MNNALPEAHVLMPVYNTESFVLGSIESVMSQDYPKIKLFILNDGSTDHSLECIREYLESQPEVKDKIILNSTTVNRGVTPVRRDLFQMSRKWNSEAYIFWLDSDDIYTDPTFIAKVIKKMQETQSDICLYNFSIIYEDELQKNNSAGLLKDKEQVYSILQDIASSPNQFIRPLEQANLLDFTSLGCTKCYGPNIQIPEAENCQYQDFVYMAALLNASRITALPPQDEPLQYLRRSESLCGQRKPENFTDHIPKQLMAFFKAVLVDVNPQKLKMAENFVMNKLNQYDQLLTQILESHSHPNIHSETHDKYQQKSNEIRHNLKNAREKLL